MDIPIRDIIPGFICHRMPLLLSHSSPGGQPRHIDGGHSTNFPLSSIFFVWKYIKTFFNLLISKYNLSKISGITNEENNERDFSSPHPNFPCPPSPGGPVHTTDSNQIDVSYSRGGPNLLLHQWFELDLQHNIWEIDSDHLHRGKSVKGHSPDKMNKNWFL